MNAATATLLLCLVGATVAEQCATRHPPGFNCRDARQGIFFPHPDDCTFLVLCVAHQDVIVSLCAERESTALYEMEYSLGCPAKCALVEPGCNWTPPPTATTPPPPPTNPSSTKCSRSGIFEDARDCTKALICASEGADVIQFDVCKNIGVDSSFPVGCPRRCPNWVPGVMADDFEIEEHEIL